ncbi:MAG: YaaR family protein [Spirochaetaceae bacterium]|jgi:uncharacterized protein YaaR (DUF327 family)|nr:YaaR family protein [Spirochaetaceae bacterium]
MAEVDSVNQQVFFTPQFRKAEKRKDPLAEKGKFASLVEQEAEEAALLGLEIPQDIAALPYGEAVVKLKDALDLAGEALKARATPENFGVYKKAVRNFVSYVASRNFEVRENVTKMKVKPGSWKEKRAVTVKVIDEKLDRLAQDVLFNQGDKFKLLSEIEEINGLVIDLLR